MRAALETLASLEITGKRYAVLGDMAELGEHAETAHCEAGEHAAKVLDGMIAIGKHAAITIEAAHAAGMGNAEAAADVGNAGKLLRDWLQPGDAVLLKASRASRLEQMEDLD